MRGSAGPVLLSLLLAVPGAHPAWTQDLVRVEGVQLEGEGRVRRAHLADLDGDGREDLVLSVADPVTVAGELWVHLATAGPARYRNEPSLRLPLTPDVVAFTVADVHADPGAEVVLLSSLGAFVWRPRAAEEERFARLLEADLLWQLADEEGPFPWPPACTDLDGDGLADLFLPEPGGYRVAYQERDAAGAARFGAGRRIEVPGEPAVALRETPVRTEDGSHVGSRTARRRTFEIRLGGGDVASANYFAGPVLDLAEEVPAPQLCDWDGDGDLDLLAQTPTRLLVWTQGPGGFPVDPVHAYALPVEVDRARSLDVSYGAALAHLDDDGRVDGVVLAGDPRTADVRTQVLVFRQGGADTATSPLFGAEGRPDQLLILAGFAGVPRLEDVDGDGRVDLVCSAIRPDLIDTLRGASGDTVEVELYVFRNDGRAFSRRPQLTARVDLPASRSRATLRFVGDATGDGVSELLTREEDGRLRLRFVRREGEGLALHPRALWELAIDEDADVEVLAPRGDGRRPVLVREERQVLLLEVGS